MEELFRQGTLEMSATPLGDLAGAPAWGGILTNQLLAVLARNKNVRRECNATTAAESGR